MRIVDFVEHPVRRVLARPVGQQVGEVEGRRVGEELDEDASRGEDVHGGRQLHSRAGVGYILNSVETKSDLGFIDLNQIRLF